MFDSNIFYCVLVRRQLNGIAGMFPCRIAPIGH